MSSKFSRKTTPQPTPAICKAPPFFPPPPAPPQFCHITLDYTHVANGGPARSWDGNFPLPRVGELYKYYNYIYPPGLHHVAAFILYDPDTLAAEIQIGIEWDIHPFDVCIHYTTLKSINPVAMKAEEFHAGQTNGNFRFYIYS